MPSGDIQKPSLEPSLLMCPTRALPLQGSLASLGLGLLLCCRTSFLTPLHGGSKTAKIRGHNRVSCKRGREFRLHVTLWDSWEASSLGVERGYTAHSGKTRTVATPEQGQQLAESTGSQENVIRHPAMCSEVSIYL